jgi:hypothetical protein
MHLMMHDFEERVFFKEGFPAGSFHRSEFSGGFAQQSHASPVQTEGGHPLPGQLAKVMHHHAHHMEAVSNQKRPWKMLSDQTAIRRAQIGANHPHLVLCLKRVEEPLQILSGFAGGNVKDTVATQVAEGGGEAFLFVEGVLVNAEDARGGLSDSFLRFGRCNKFSVN